MANATALSGITGQACDTEADAGRELGEPEREPTEKRDGMVTYCEDSPYTSAK